MLDVAITSPPRFRAVECGDYVVIKRNRSFPQTEKVCWWVGQVIHKMGSARDPSINSFFQVVDIDTGSIKIINANSVKEILKSNT